MIGLPPATPEQTGAGAPEPVLSSADLLQDSLNSVSKGTTILVLSTAVFLGLGFLGRVVAARSLPVAAFGEFNLGVSFTTLLSIMILLGLNQALARMLAWEHDAGERRTLIRWSIAVASASSTAGSVAVFVWATQLAQLFHNPALIYVFQLLAVSVGMGAITPIFASIFQGFHNVVPNALFNQFINPLLFVVFVYLLLYVHWGLTGVIVAYVIADVVAFVGIVIYTAHYLPKIVPRTAKGPPRPKPLLWVLTVSMWGVSSLGFVTGYADTIILGVYHSALLVGYYSTSMTMTRVILLAAQSLTYIYLPMTARLARLNAHAALRSTYITATRWILVLTFPLFLMFVFAPTLTIDALFGPKYEPAALSLQFLAIAAFLSNVVGPVNACLGGLGLARTQLWTSSTAAATNLVLSFALIPTFGVLGATAAWAIARAMYPGLGLAALNRAHGITPFRRVLLLPVAVTMAFGIPVMVVAERLPLPHWVVVPLFFFGSGLYILSLVATNCMLPGDLATIVAAERVLRTPLPRLRRLLEKHVAVDPFLDTRPAGPT
ncbi:MAG: oligosaccharide flippase family protein [Thermoplasmata archaeon]